MNSTKARPERYTDNGVSIGEFLTLGFACFIALLFSFGIIGWGAYPSYPGLVIGSLQPGI